MLQQGNIPIGVVIARIASVVGLSAALAVGILLLLGGYWVGGIVSLVCAVPFFGLLRFVEYRGERGRLREHY